MISASNPVAGAQGRIAALAAATPTHRAFHWLHLHQPQLRQWLLELVRIPAPAFAEEARARALLSVFESLGLTCCDIDREGNVLAELAPSAAGDPVLLLSAHLDTVFPAGTDCTPREEGSRILAPGACDNAAGLSALLGLAAALRFAAITPPCTLLFCANTGEEGEGNLRGLRHLFEHGRYAGRIAASIVLDGAGDSAVVTRALGSGRLRLTVTGPGGHSWSDAGTPNAITLLAEILTALTALPLPETPRTTLNVGLITGGTSINSIPASASAQLDLRSTDAGTLASVTEDLLLRAREVFDIASRRTPAHPAPTLRIESIGDRPAATLPDTAPLLYSLRAVDRHLGLRTDPRIGSTDANLPLSLGIPAIALGTGGAGGGIHTLGEWYDPAGRETALRRILLTLLDTVNLLAEPG